MLRLLVSFCALLGCAVAAHPAEIGPLPLWTGTAPGDKGDLGAEHDTTTAKDALVAGKPVARITNVTAPTITVYQPENASGAAVLVFPGGGYSILALDLEGTEVCQWLNSVGVTAVLLKYRVPARHDLPRYLPPLQDAQRAIGMVRAHAAEWNIDPHRVGVLGFSAGGHLAAALSTNNKKRLYDHVDASDDLPCRPDFAVLIYPGGLVPKDSNQLSPELHISRDIPPTFIAQTEDDPVHVENSLAYYAALKGAKVPVEMHLYPSGGHGYGLRKSEHLVTTWPARVDDWMHSIGILK